jgi:chemotaxis protein methyltransferase CheR
MGARVAFGEADYREATRLVAERSGQVFAPNRRVEAEAGLARAMRRAGTTDAAAYLASLSRNPGALDALVDEVTVGETHFMRDPEQWDLLRRELLVRQHPPRVWSAGCASGEEAFSLAILLEEEGLAEGAVVLGTDLSELALGKARRGSYTNWSMRGVSDRFLEAYFRPDGERHRVVDRLRSRVRFERLNLVGGQDYAESGAWGMDVILCRNVLIYFDHPTAAHIAGRLFACLAPGGVLLTGGADPLLREFAPFEVEVTRVGLVYRRPRSSPLAVAPAPAEPAPRVLAAPDRREASPPPPPVAAGPDLGQEAFARVTAQANARGALSAERMAEAALRRHTLDAPLHYLRATLLVALDRDEEAEREAERALYLDRTLAVGHFLLGTILRRRGARRDARRAFRNARDLCATRPRDEELPASSGERSGALHAAAAAELASLEASGE